MKASISWLKDYVEIKADIKELCHKLTMSGLHVEGLEKVGGDHCIEFEVTANRNDCLSIIGIAREIAAITGKSLKNPLSSSRTRGSKNVDSRLHGNDKKSPSLRGAERRSNLNIIVEDKKLCPLYTGRIIKNVKVSESPDWLKKKLLSVGVRPVNNIVDITNLLLMETGQPMHAFDLDKLNGRIIVRKAKKNEEMQTIDQVKRKLDSNMLVIADNSGPVAIAGIMGGLNTEVDFGTKNILLESAYFDAVNVRQTARTLALSSESSYRFERKVDQEMIEPASKRAANLIRDIAGGTEESFKDVGTKTLNPIKVHFDPVKSNKILGIEIPVKKQKSILSALGFTVSGAGKNFTVKAPSFRKDVSQSVDITEEVIRIYGYENIPLTIPKIVAHAFVMTMEGEVESKIKNTLSCQGLDEVVTYNMCSKSAAGKFTDTASMAEIKNPLSKEQEVLSSTLIPGMLKSIAYNINHKNSALNLFEIGKIYCKKDKKYQEEPALSMAVSGLAVNDWLSKQRQASLFDLKGSFENLISLLGIKGVTFRPCGDISYLSAGAEIIYKNNKIGIMGKVDSGVLSGFDIDNDVFILEVKISGIVKDTVLDKRYMPLPKYPSAVRDISMLVKKDVTAEAITLAIKKSDTGIIKDVSLADTYKGKQVPNGMISYLYRIEYRDDSKTLTENEVESLHSKVKQALSTDLGISFR